MKRIKDKVRIFVYLTYDAYFVSNAPYKMFDGTWHARTVQAFTEPVVSSS